MKSNHPDSRWTPIAEPCIISKVKHIVCRCACGTVKTLQHASWLSGQTKSCGCLVKELHKARMTKHGQIESRTYQTWKSMRQRCFNKNNSNYWRYGGAGISVTPAWSTYETFLSDMGECPDGMELDRIDNNQGYSKENCRWVTHRDNSRNRGCTLIYKGKQMFHDEIAKNMGIGITTLWRRRKDFPNLTLEELAFL